ncbi:hypothetical protein AB0425_31400 [Actinosynnema sp. NPDC051121]
MMVNEEPEGEGVIDDELLEPVPAWLEEAPDAMPVLAVTQPQVLPFQEVTPENFERLVLGLARREGEVVHAQLYGTRGQDQHGIDLYWRMRSPGASGRWYRTVQCRNVAEVTATDLAAAVEDFLGGAWARRTDTFVFATRVATVRSDRAEAIEVAAAQLNEIGIAFEVWDGEFLSHKLTGLPDLVDRFFGREAVRAFCGHEAAERLAGRTHALVMLEGLETRLRERTPSSLTASAVGEERVEPADDLVLDRSEVRERVTDAMRSAGESVGAVVVHGEPDVGKSVLMLGATATLRLGGMGVVALSLRDVSPGPLSSLEQLLGAPIARVFEYLEAEQVRVIALDGAEVVLEGGADLFTDLSRAARAAGVGVVAVVRDDARQAVVEALGAVQAHHAGADSAQPVLIEVPALSSEEVSRVRAAFPELERVGEDPRAGWLLGRVGLVDLLLRAGAIGALPDGALSEADVFAAVWSRWVRRGERVDRGGATPDGRDEALMELARRRLLPDEPSRPIEPYALHSLRSDGLLLSADDHFAWSVGDEFASDVVRDLSTSRLFGRDGLALLNRAGAPRWTLRAARIASQVMLISGQRRPDATSVVEQTFRRLQVTFDEVSARHGDRWADVPLEAALTMGQAAFVFAACGTDLLASSGSLLDRALRLVTQRYSRLDAVDPVVGSSLVAFALDHMDQFDDVDRDVTERTMKVITSWLRGVNRLEREGQAHQTDIHRPLRQRVRDYVIDLLDNHKATHTECLALLGSDSDERVRASLRALADSKPSLLYPCVEHIDAVLGLGHAELDLLFELTEAYYIEQPKSGHWSSWSRESGIRGHRMGVGIGVPQAAWYYGPFYELLRRAPARALALINRILDHGAATRVRRLMGLATSQPLSPDNAPGLKLDVSTVGERYYIGDEHVWAWYRGTTVGERPCISALLAVERIADEALSRDVPIARMVELLLTDAHNLAMPGLVVGLLVRHLDKVTVELDEWLTTPDVWELEFFRRGHEIGIHAQGRDPEDTVGRERRAWTVLDLAATLTLTAQTNGDQTRLEQLRTIGEKLLLTAHSIISASETGTSDGDASHVLPHEVEPAVEEALLTVRRWASMLDAAQYRLVAVPGGAMWEWQAPEDIFNAMEDTQRDLDRTNEAYGLLNRYSLRPDPPTHDLPVATPPEAQLLADVTLARSLAEDPPQGGLSDKTQVPTAVAAAAIRAAYEGGHGLGEEELKWAMTAVVDAALHPLINAHSYEGSRFTQGSDRVAASAVPFLLTAAFTEAPSGPEGRPLHEGDDLAVTAEALKALTTSLYTEVRRITARTLNVVWTAPCGPGGYRDATCRHVVAWEAAEDGMRHVAMGPWSESGTRSPRNLDGLIAPALRAASPRDLLLNYLGPAVIASCDAVRSGCCVAADAGLVRDALLDAYARTAMHWGTEGYQCQPEDHCAVATALLATASNDAAPLLAVVAGLSSQASALFEFLHALETVATYDVVARTSFREIWPGVMDTVLDAVEAGSSTFDDGSWGDYALAAVIPSPQHSVSDSNPGGTTSAAHAGWPTPEELLSRIERWLPHAAGQRHAADDLIGLLKVAPLTTQASLGLPWVQKIVTGGRQWDHRRTWYTIDWLKSLRDGQVLDDTTQLIYNELVDVLAADGYQEAVNLQRDAE